MLTNYLETICVCEECLIVIVNQLRDGNRIWMNVLNNDDKIISHTDVCECTDCDCYDDCQCHECVGNDECNHDCGCVCTCAEMKLSPASIYCSCIIGNKWSIECFHYKGCRTTRYRISLLDAKMLQDDNTCILSNQIRRELMKEIASGKEQLYVTIFKSKSRIANYSIRSTFRTDP